jgi:hypothetical protein
LPETTPLPASVTPSSRKLLRSTLIAALTAIVLLATVILPAEYGVDPTGIGRVLGLTKMGEIKMQLAREAAADALVDSSTGVPAANRPASSPSSLPIAPRDTVVAPTSVATAGMADTVEVTLRPGQGREIKLAMKKGARVAYSWSTDRGVVNYDTHADRSEPPAIKYHGYAKGQSTPSDTGELVAAFDGMHGWFWRNRTSESLTVTLRTSGEYTELKEIN